MDHRPIYFNPPSRGHNKVCAQTQYDQHIYKGFEHGFWPVKRRGQHNSCPHELLESGGEIGCLLAGKFGHEGLCPSEPQNPPILAARIGYNAQLGTGRQDRRVLGPPLSRGLMGFAEAQQMYQLKPRSRRMSISSALA